jgi:diguanylate cyclase (GGDEF)-like protein
VSATAYAGTAASSRTTPTGLPRAARNFLLQTGAVAIAFGVAASLSTSKDGRWSTFVVLLLAALGAQAAAVHVSGNQVFHTGLAFTVAAAVSLQPREVIAICIAQHLADWVRRKYPWYIQTFNILNYSVSALAAWAVNKAVLGSVSEPPRFLHVVAAVGGGAAFVLTNHALLARMLNLARAYSLKATGLFSLDGILTDASLAATGVGVAIALRNYPSAALVAALPLFLIHRALVIPELRLQAARDPKTALLNMRGFRDAATDELARAERFERPLAVLLADVDDMRGINNEHGHLTGDAALSTVAEAIRTTTRDFDLCARFGGDEFVLLLPETTREDAEGLAARLEERLANEVVAVGSVSTRVGISIGIAALGPGTTTLDELLQCADASMYEAKRRRTAVPA